MSESNVETIMSLTKQAKVLTDKQVKVVLKHLTGTRHAKRNRVMFFLSLHAGLRAKEIAEISWAMVTNGDGEIGDEISLTNKAAKGKSGGVVAMSKELRSALMELAADGTDGNIIKVGRGRATSAQVVTNWFFTLYRDLGFEGCSSHSGRRTAITRWARNISLVGGSMRDVQSLARHSSLALTQRYVETNSDAQKAVVNR
jgi:integrase